MNFHKSLKLVCILAVFLASCSAGKTSENPPVENTPVSTEAAQTQAAGAPTATSVPGEPTIEPLDDNLFSFIPMGVSIKFDFPQDYDLPAISSFVAKSLQATGLGEPLYPEHARILFRESLGDTVSATDPGIRVFRASEVNEADPKAFESLDAVLKGQLDQHSDFPRFAGAANLVDAQVVLFPFQNGNGYRYLFVKKFDASSLSSTSMTYLYQGLTLDGQYMVTLIANIDAPFLEDLATGQPFTTNDEIIAYKNLVNNRLNTADPNQFNPPLSMLDRLVSSITIISK